MSQPWHPHLYSLPLWAHLSQGGSCSVVWLTSVCFLSVHVWPLGAQLGTRRASCFVICCANMVTCVCLYYFHEVSPSLGTVCSSFRSLKAQHLAYCKPFPWFLRHCLESVCFMPSQRKMPRVLSDACLARRMISPFFASVWMSCSQNLLGFLVYHIDIFSKRSPSIVPIKGLYFINLAVIWLFSSALSFIYYIFISPYNFILPWIFFSIPVF